MTSKFQNVTNKIRAQLEKTLVTTLINMLMFMAEIKDKHYQTKHNSNCNGSD